MPQPPVSPGGQPPVAFLVSIQSVPAPLPAFESAKPQVLVADALAVEAQNKRKTFSFGWSSFISIPHSRRGVSIQGS